MNMELWPLAINSRDAVAAREVRAPELDLPVRRGWLQKFLSWFKRSRRPRAIGKLSELNSYLLRDVGVSPDDIAAEKWFWRGGWGEISSIRDRHRRW